MAIDEFFTLERAAEYLGVSSRTLRRWIKSGKLHARLEPGPYGRQYVVPESSLRSVQLVRDVERIERQEEREAIPATVEAYLAERESALGREIAALRAELHEALQQLQTQQAAILELIGELRPAQAPPDGAENSQTP